MCNAHTATHDRASIPNAMHMILHTKISTVGSSGAPLPGYPGNIVAGCASISLIASRNRAQPAKRPFTGLPMLPIGCCGLKCGVDPRTLSALLLPRGDIERHRVLQPIERLQCRLQRCGCRCLRGLTGTSTIN